jgi:hypothetical protein
MRAGFVQLEGAAVPFSSEHVAYTPLLAQRPPEIIVEPVGRVAGACSREGARRRGPLLSRSGVNGRTDELEQRVVHLVGVRPRDRVWAAFDHDELTVVDEIG